LIVKTETAVAVTDAGLKLALAPVGRPEKTLRAVERPEYADPALKKIL
jgi:hypothetical protein